MSLAPIRDAYVTANFTETQVQYFRPGMEADVEVDMLGGRVLHGSVESLAPASGSEFAVLPPQTAIGNFTKIVQRIPVRVRIASDDRAALSKLSAGASMVVNVNTRDAAK